MARKEPKPSVVKKLFALTGNRCAFPDCDQKIVNENQDLVAQICHIEAAEEGGERYNPDMTDEERRAFENLIILCPTHHVTTNNIEVYTVEKLKEMKSNHESQFSFVTQDQIDDVLVGRILKHSGFDAVIKHVHEHIVVEEEREAGVIEDIFSSVLATLNEGLGSNYTPDERIDLPEKIELNFPDESDKEEVSQYARFAFKKMDLVEQRFGELDTEQQNDMHAYIVSKYKGLKRSGISNIEILEKLVEEFTPEGKEHLPKYSNLSRALVLMFFDDCTIFEKK